MWALQSSQLWRWMWALQGSRQLQRMWALQGSREQKTASSPRQARHGRRGEWEQLEQMQKHRLAGDLVLRFRDLGFGVFSLGFRLLGP